MSKYSIKLIPLLDTSILKGALWKSIRAVHLTGWPIERLALEIIFREDDIKARKIYIEVPTRLGKTYIGCPRDWRLSAWCPEDQLRAPLKPLNTIVLWCPGRFRGRPMMPRDASIRLTAVVFPVWMSQQESYNIRKLFILFIGKVKFK